MPNFSIPLSGLDADEQALTVISNNLSNLNTIGYKAASSDFSDLFYQQFGTSGAGDPLDVGSGTQMAQVETNYSQGALNSDGVNSHAAIQGTGFFVVNQNGEQEYTRAGDFTVNSSGDLTTADGGLVLGYGVSNGAINTNAEPASLNVGPGETSPPSASTTMNLNLNLDSSAAVGTTFDAPIQVFDSLGGSHVLTATFTKSASNTWGYNVTIPAADITGAASPVSVASGTLNFTSGGLLASGSQGNITVSTSGSTLSDGAATLNVAWNVVDSNKNSLITQTNTSSAVTSTNQNGYAPGTLQTFNVQPDGTIVGSYSNGETALLGQLAIASFTNPEGLSRGGNNNYVLSFASGAANIGIANTGGRGSVLGGALEQSNVDIAAQFAALIQAERGYQANAKTVTTFDAVTQDALNMQAGP